jgi:uncharacterized protein (TIGR02147 family)
MITNVTKPLPNLFEYDNYRLFVKDAYEALKTNDPAVSFRSFARAAGFKSHNFLSLIIEGKSNISLESADKIGKVFQLNAEEALFFRNLVLLNQAKNNDEKHLYAKEILRSKTYRKIHPFNESKYEFFAHWYVSAVRELVALPKFKEDPAWIASHVIPPIKPAEAKKALEDLLNLGLVQRNEEGRLVQSDALLSTPPEVSSAYIANWHKEYMKRALESLDLLPRDQRDISAVTIGFSKKNLAVLKEMLINFRKGVLHLASQQSEQSEKDILVQVNVQMFLLAETDSDEGA